MKKFLALICLTAFLTSCAYFNNNKCCNSYARSKEAKRRLMFINATNNELLATQRNAELDNLNYDRRCGCY